MSLNNTIKYVGTFGSVGEDGSTHSDVTLQHVGEALLGGAAGNTGQFAWLDDDYEVKQ